MTQIIYDLYLDPTNERLERMVVTTLCASRPAEGAGGEVSLEDALTKHEHIAFKADYRISDRDAVDRFEVPAEAARAMR